MAVYDLSFMENSTNLLQLALGISTATDSYILGNLTLLSFFIIFLVLTFRHNFLEVLVIDCFLSTLVGLLLYATGLISAVTIIYPFVLLIVSFIIYFFS